MVFAYKKRQKNKTDWVVKLLLKIIIIKKIGKLKGVLSFYIVCN